jgi:ataxin-10
VQFGVCWSLASVALPGGQAACVLQMPAPYPTYRSDVLQTIGNLAYRRKAVQDCLAKLDIVELVMSNCAFVPDYPGVREWALWAVRNMCEGNEAVQERIKGLQGHAVMDDAELKTGGQHVLLDRGTGKFTVVGTKV